MERNLVTNLFLHKSIQTTPKKAAVVIPLVDKLINVVNSKDELNAIRFVMQYVFTKESSKELFKNIAPKYKGNKTSGFTRTTAIRHRDGDGAKIVLLELI